jgi:trk system potassium uptake protein TrkA
MKIIIAGAGEVGYHLAKLLVKESQEIVIIDLDKQKLNQIESKLDVITILGDCTSFKILRQANVETSDIFIAVTEIQDTNLTSAMIAKKLGAKKTIARVSNPEYLLRENAIPIMRSGIDSIISPEQLAANEIIELVENAQFNGIHPFEKGELNLIGIKIDENSCLLGDCLAKVLNTSENQNLFKPIAIVREENGIYETIIPHDDFKLEAEDLIYFISKKEAKAALTKFTNIKGNAIKSIVVLGGGRIGKKTTIKLLDLGYRVKLIEREEQVAEAVSEEILNATIIYGDARDGEILEEAGIEETDLVIAVTGRSETNIMASLLSKSKGVKKTIALVENIDYINLSQDIGISSFVNKKLLAADHIFKFVRKGHVLDMTHLSDLEAEVLEYRVNEDSKIENKTIKELNLPKGLIIAGIIRKKEGIIATENHVFLAGDKVVLFAKPDAIVKAENLFLEKTFLDKFINGII